MRAIHHPGYGGFLSCERPWRELTAAARSLRFFNAYDWYAAFFTHLQPSAEPLGVIELQQGERCVGLLPYHHRRIRKGGIEIKALCLPASPHLILADAVLSDSLAAGAALGAIRRCLAQHRIGWHALLLPNVREDSHALRLALALGGRAIIQPAGGSRYFDVTQPYEKLSQRFAGQLRKNLRKGVKRLEQSGAVEFLSIRAGDARMPWAFERFLALEASGWKGEAGTGSAIALNEGIASFYRHLVGAESEALRAEVNLLCLDGAPIAGQFATVCRSHRSIHKIAYDESFQHASPGTVLMARALEHSCKDEAIESLSLVTDMPWMRDWNASCAAVYEVWLPKSALLCGLARAAVRSKHVLTAVRQVFRAPSPGLRDDGSSRAHTGEAPTPHSASSPIPE